MNVLAEAATSTNTSSFFSLRSPELILVVAVLGLIALVPVINGILSIIKFFRSEPPAHEVYAAKLELAQIEERLSKEVAQVESRLPKDYATKNDLDHLERRLSNDLSIDKGDLEKLERRIKEDRDAMEKRVHDHLSKSDGELNSVSRGLRQVHTQLGNIFGMLEGKRRQRSTGD